MIKYLTFKYLTSVALVLVLVGGGGALALAVTGSPNNGSNAAVTQYGPVPTTPPSGETPPPSGETLPKEGHGGHGVKGTREVGGKTKHGGGEKPAGSGEEGVETASTGPVAAAGGLPFTGLNALALAGVGLLLLLAGLMQRRFESKRRS